MDPESKPNSLTVGYLNIQGQGKLTQSKQNQIEHLVKSHRCDILNLQESNVSSDAFEHCPYIANNFHIIAQNSDTGFGVCSLVHKRIPIENEYLHPSGRIIAFEVHNLSIVNVYLPSGSEHHAKNLREDLIGQTIPNLLLNKDWGIIGGDFNCISQSIDCTHHPEQKISSNLKRIIPLLKWRDTFRTLHPKKVTYSHFYSRQMSATGLTKGASRLDRSYSWGQVNILSSEYAGAPFSDHMMHIVKVEFDSSILPAEPIYKPYFKINPEIAKDDEFKAKVKEISEGWLKSKYLIPLLQWWDLLKKDVRQAAKIIQKKKALQKKSKLNYLMLAQAHLSKKVSTGNLDLLPQLKEIQLQISNWFDAEADKVKLHARLGDVEVSEKVRIFHHEQLYRTINRSSILKLKTAQGIVTGHTNCANTLNKEVEELLSEKAHLDEDAQENLLNDVEATFTTRDNEMLEAEITDTEVRESLKKSNKSAAPGCDGLTFLTYDQCWSSLGGHLCEVIRHVVKEGSPSESMRHSLLVFSPKAGKANSLLPRDKRKISLLQSDHKILSGILAARLRRTEDHTLSQHQYAAGPRRITHAISQARDAIQSVSAHHKGSSVVQTDFVSAFDKLSISWTWKVLAKKKCSPIFIQVLKNIYEDNPSYVINIINNQQQPRIENKRKSIYQGDRTSTVLYNFSVDPLLIHLHKRLKGLVYHRLATEGPKHPLFGPPTPVVAKLVVLGFVDDVKAVVNSLKEFHLLDNGLKMFELASGSQLHRNPETKKCQILTLGKWSTWKQSDSPLPYMEVVDHLNFLGVTLARTSSKSRAINSEILSKKVKSTMAMYKAGRHSPLVCRPYTVNTFVMSKICYRSSIINLRSKDIHSMQSSVKSWVTQNLLLKPPEVLLYRDVAEGGLGLIHTESRCTANLIRTFVEQAHPNSRFPNVYLNTLFRCFVLKEDFPGGVKRPPYFSERFFEIISEAMEDEHDHLHLMSTRSWQRRLLEREITHRRDPLSGISDAILTSQELKHSQADWLNVWCIRRTAGLTPWQMSWLFEFSNGLHVNNDRLNKLGKITSDKCDFCCLPDTRCHLLFCSFNNNIGQKLLLLLSSMSEKSPDMTSLGIVDLHVSRPLQLPLLFTVCEVMNQMQISRTKKQAIVPEKMSASILATSSVFLLSKKFCYAHETINSWLQNYFNNSDIIALPAPAARPL